MMRFSYLFWSYFAAVKMEMKQKKTVVELSSHKEYVMCIRYFVPDSYRLLDGLRLFFFILSFIHRLSSLVYS